MSAERTRLNYTELQNPLFVHPSDRSNSLGIEEKLTGVENYRSWRRNLEIALSTKRKLGFVHGTIAKPVDDPIKQEQWETCNNLVISWLINVVSDSISKSILYIQSASEIWEHLERRFNISNGSRKYKLNKHLCAMKQNNSPVSEYYTKMQGYGKSWML